MKFVLWAKHIRDDQWKIVTRPASIQIIESIKENELEDDDSEDYEFEIHLEGIDPNDYGESLN